MTAPPHHCFLTVGSQYDAAVQLIYKFPPKYRLVRQTHFRHVVAGTTLSFPQLIRPSHGTCEFTYRIPADPAYEVEFLQTTVVKLRTVDGQTATKVEKRAFRIRNARWSLWTVQTDDEGFDVVTWKLADMTLDEVKSVQQIGPSEADVVQKALLKGKPWQDAYGTHRVMMCVWVGWHTCWELGHLIDRGGPGQSEICMDQFWPVVEGAGGGVR